MPVEFTGACYRFGHATAQFKYAMRQGDHAEELFDTEGLKRRPADKNVDLKMFFEVNGHAKPQKARPVGTGVAEALFNLPMFNNKMFIPEIDVTLTKPQTRNLPLRNLIRDRYTYQLASGQQVAKHVGSTPVDVPKELAKYGFTKTPLWFYALQEAEELGSGKLTGAGGSVVASVFANLLKRDCTTFIHLPHFKPWQGFSGQPTCLAGMISYVENFRKDIPDPHKLMSG